MSPQFVYQQAKEGKLPTVEFGKRRLVVRELLDRMLLERAEKMA